MLRGLVAFGYRILFGRSRRHARAALGRYQLFQLALKAFATGNVCRERFFKLG